MYSVFFLNMIGVQSNYFRIYRYIKEKNNIAYII